MRTHRLTLLTAPLFIAFPVSAQTDADAPSAGRGVFGIEAAPLVGPLIADRPDFTESAFTVAKGHLQIEGGFTYYDDPDVWTLPEVLLRLGLTHDLELRLRLPDYFNADDGPGDDDGLTDMSVGVKWKFLEQDAAVPHLAVIPYITLPTGDDDFGNDGVEIGAILAAAWDLGDRYTLGANLGLQTFDKPGDDESVQTSTSVSLGIPITDATGAFVEYFAIYPGSFDDAAHGLDGGVTHHLHDNLMLDARIGFGLSDEAPDFFLGAGVTYRY